MPELPDPEDTTKRVLACRRRAMRLRDEFDETGDESKRIAAINAETDWTTAMKDLLALTQAGIKVDLKGDELGSTMFAPWAKDGETQ